MGWLLSLLYIITNYDGSTYFVEPHFKLEVGKMYVFKFKRIPKSTVNIQNVRTFNDVTIIIISSLLTGQYKRLSEAQLTD